MIKIMKNFMNSLKPGDTIKCANADGCINTMMALTKEGVETDFLYMKDGEKGLWLKVIEVTEYGQEEN